MLKSVAASLQRERDLVRCDLLKADQENVTLSFKVATLTHKLSYASQINSLPSEGGSLKNSGSSKDLGDSGQETVSTVAAQDTSQDASVTTSQVMNSLCLRLLAFGFSHPTSNIPSMLAVWSNLEAVYTSLLRCMKGCLFLGPFPYYHYPHTFLSCMQTMQEYVHIFFEDM